MDASSTDTLKQIDDALNTKFTLSIDRCPVHGYYAVSVNRRDADGGGSGTRLTPSKCCGRWDETKSWTMTKDRLRQVAKDILEYAEVE